MSDAELSAPSPFLTRHLPWLREAGRRGMILDLACGRGRHALAVGETGARTLGLDRDPGALAELNRRARSRRLPVHGIRADAESEHGIPLQTGRCGAILVFRFLYRPLCPALVEALQPGGLLLYETFTVHQRQLGYGPVNPEFLLLEGELPQLFPELEILEAWEGVTETERPAALARLLARRA